MKTFKTTLTLAALGLVTLLTGCATPNMQATFTRGDEVVYGRVVKTWSNAPGANGAICGGKYPLAKAELYSPELDSWVDQTSFCDKNNLSSIQQVMVTVGVVNVNGDSFNLFAFPSQSLKFDKGDIVAVKIYPSADGRFRRPSEIISVAAKAKDATKENGCYWDAGTGVFSGFNQGGAICGNWNWKNHPLSNPSLLKK